MANRDVNLEIYYSNLLCETNNSLNVENIFKESENIEQTINLDINDIAELEKQKTDINNSVDLLESNLKSLLRGLSSRYRNKNKKDRPYDRTKYRKESIDPIIENIREIVGKIYELNGVLEKLNDKIEHINSIFQQEL